MITCKMNGGLGNQLFEIFNTISLAIDNNTDFVFLYTTFVTNRSTYWENFLNKLKKYTVENLPNIEHQYCEPCFEYVPVKYHQNMCLNGYFQSEKYFANNYNKITEIIGLSELINNLKEKIGSNYDFNNTISMHFRLGDYKYNPYAHPILTLDYYINSIEHIINKTNKNDYTVIYYCENEDMSTVNGNINALQNKFESFKFVRFRGDYADHEEMLSMSLCTHNIIANSTFSWWGAYFNTNNEKIITYPCIWFGPKLADKNLKDLHPSSWIKI